MNEIFVIVFLMHLLVIAITDIRGKRIPNPCIISLCVTAAVFLSIYRRADLSFPFWGAVSVSVPMLMITLVVPGAFGMGDVKFMVAGGLFLGWKITLLSTIIAFVVCGLYIITVAVFQVIRQKIIAEKRIGRKALHRKTEIAFGAFLSVGMAAGLLWGDELIDWYKNSPLY